MAQAGLSQSEAMLALQNALYGDQRSALYAQRGTLGAQQDADQKLNDLEKAYWEGRPGAAQQLAEYQRQLNTNQLGDATRQIDMDRFGVTQDYAKRGAWGTEGQQFRNSDLDKQLMYATSNSQIKGRQIDTELAEQLAQFKYRADRAGLQKGATAAQYASQLAQSDAALREAADRNAITNASGYWDIFGKSQSVDALNSIIAAQQAQAGVNSPSTWTGNPNVVNPDPNWGAWGNSDHGMPGGIARMPDGSWSQDLLPGSRNNGIPYPAQSSLGPQSRWDAAPKPPAPDSGYNPNSRWNLG